MEKILIINLKRLGDIFQSGHLIQSLKSQPKNCEVHFLCYEECAKAARTLALIDKVHTIDRKKVISYYKNNIYSDGLAFNELNNALNEVTCISFSKVLNFSNDRVSSFLSSYIADETRAEVLGIRFSPRQTVQYCSEASLIFNDVMTQTPFTPFSFNEAMHSICQTKIVPPEKSTIKASKTHDKTAVNNLNRLRSLKNEDVNKVSIVGIQLCSASAEKDINQGTLIDFIRLISQSETMIPILLIAPFEGERKKAAIINKEFNNRLVSVEADLIALPSVLKNLDLLVTPDTAVKHLADCLETPLIEVSMGHAPMYKQGTINPYSAVISESGHKRIFREGVEPRETILKNNARLSGAFLFNCANSLLGSPEESQSIPGSSPFCIYRPMTTNGGSFLMPETGPYSPSFEARRVLSRSICQKLSTGSLDEDLIAAAYSVITKKEFQDVLEEEKQCLSLVTKDLLSTLRGLIQTQENKAKAPSFIEALERLLSRCFDNNLAAIPAQIFRAKVDALNSNSLDENFKEVEAHLYELKDSLQSCLYVFKKSEEIGYGVGQKRTQDTWKEKTL